MTPDAIHRAILALQRADAIAERKPEAKGIRVHLLEALGALQEAARDHA